MDCAGRRGRLNAREPVDRSSRRLVRVMEERKDEMSRRRFLGRLGLLGAVGVALPVWRLSPAVALPDEALTCDDVSGLTEQQVQTREALKYVDQSPDPKK